MVNRCSYVEMCLSHVIHLRHASTAVTVSIMAIYLSCVLPSFCSLSALSDEDNPTRHVRPAGLKS